MATTYGYARVSTQAQNLDRQISALREFGVERLITDKVSGKNFERPGYKRLFRKLEAGDVLVIMSIDRLGRNYGEILEEWRLITKVKKAHVVVLDMPLLDTRVSKVKGVTGAFIADLVLQILSYVAQVERENMRSRQRQGIDAALARGVRFGRPRLERPENYEEAKQRVEAGLASQREGAELIGVSCSTFRRWLSADEELAQNCA